MTTRRQTILLVPLGPTHRRLWRSLGRRCSCGLPAPCAASFVGNDDQRVQPLGVHSRAPAGPRAAGNPTPFPRHAAGPPELPELRGSDTFAGGACRWERAARPAPTVAGGLRADGGRRPQSSNAGAPRAQVLRAALPPSRPPAAAPSTAIGRVAAHGEYIRGAGGRDRIGGRPRWEVPAEIGRAGSLTPAQEHRANGGHA